MFKLILIENYVGGHYFSQFLEDTTCIVGNCMTGAFEICQNIYLTQCF